MSVVLDQPGYGPLTLKKGIAVHLGSITAADDAIEFVLPGVSHDYEGGLVIQAVGDGTITTLTTELDVSLDHSNFSKLVDGPTAAAPVVQFDVKGLGGQLLKLLASAVTLGTATKIDLYAVVG